MITQLTLFVKHGETTDPLHAFITLAEGLPEVAEGLEEVSVIATDFIVDVPDPGVNAALAPLSWTERAKMESGKPIFTYEATHKSRADGSDAMCIGYRDSMIVLTNEDGFEWTDDAHDWEPIP